MKNIDNNSAVSSVSAINSTNSVYTWREEDGVIYLSVTSNGKTGEEWIEYLEEQRYYLSSEAKRSLLSNLCPTSGVTTEIAIITSRLLVYFDKSEVLAEAMTRKFAKPNPEVACLIREVVSDKDMKIMGIDRIHIMHESIMVDFSLIGKCLGNFEVSRANARHALIMSHRYDEDYKCGYAFVVSQTNS